MEKESPNHLLYVIRTFEKIIFRSQITSIEEEGTHPTLPSSKRISFHSRMLLSLISTLRPSCRTKRLVPLSLGVLRTVTLGDKIIASLRLVK